LDIQSFEFILQPLDVLANYVFELILEIFLMVFCFPVLFDLIMPENEFLLNHIISVGIQRLDQELFISLIMVDINLSWERLLIPEDH